jgi:two-component system KDP operon response regulator KdpE
MSPATRVLVVDDEAQIRRFLRTSLTAEGYSVIEAETGGDAILQAAREEPDVIVLDLGLPDIDGAKVIAEVRKSSQAPIIVLSIRNDEKGKVEALDLGADDYITKPFGVDELLARLRAALRHRLKAEGAAPVFRCGDLGVDLVRRMVTLNGTEIKLSAKEYDLLRLLILHEGKVLTHGFMLREVWGPAHAEDVQYLRVYIRHLREKLEADPTRPAYILTETGVGYRLRAPE